jgi:hypothetical protein
MLGIHRKSAKKNSLLWMWIYDISSCGSSRYRNVRAFLEVSILLSTRTETAGIPWLREVPK